MSCEMLKIALFVEIYVKIFALYPNLYYFYGVLFK